jgi:hypothetical protein
MNEPTPDIEDVQQYEEEPALIVVPTRVVESTPLQTHALPARNAVMRSVTSNPDGSVIQLVGRDQRRSRITVWAQGETDGDFIFIGVDKNEVESGTAAHMLAGIPGGLAPSPLLVMSHCDWIYVRNTGVNPVIVSFCAEYWAD